MMAAPLIEVPRSHGRRAYDKVPVMAKLISTLGFPIVAFLLAWGLIVGRLDRLTTAIDANTRAVMVLICRMDPPSCGKDQQP